MSHIIVFITRISILKTKQLGARSLGQSGKITKTAGFRKFPARKPKGCFKNTSIHEG
jgi:hypothetical protein